MPYLDNAADFLISEFGEEVDIVSRDSENPDDASNPMYFSSSEGSSVTKEVRLMASPSEEMLQEYGFEQETSTVIYESVGDIQEGDLVQYEEVDGDTAEYVVARKTEHQMGNGEYRFVYSLQRRE